MFLTKHINFFQNIPNAFHEFLRFHWETKMQIFTFRKEGCYSASYFHDSLRAVIGVFIQCSPILFLLLIFGREEERQTLICCSTYVCIHWLILDGTRNHGIAGQCCNQLSQGQSYYFFI